MYRFTILDAFYIKRFRIRLITEVCVSSDKEIKVEGRNMGRDEGRDGRS